LPQKSVNLTISYQTINRNLQAFNITLNFLYVTTSVIGCIIIIIIAIWVSWVKGDVHPSVPLWARKSRTELVETLVLQQHACVLPHTPKWHHHFRAERSNNKVDNNRFSQSSNHPHITVDMKSVVEMLTTGGK